MDALRSILWLFIFVVAIIAGTYFSRPKCRACKRGRLITTFDGDGVEIFRCDSCGKQEWRET